MHRTAPHNRLSNPQCQWCQGWEPGLDPGGKPGPPRRSPRQSLQGRAAEQEARRGLSQPCTGSGQSFLLSVWPAQDTEARHWPPPSPNRNRIPPLTWNEWMNEWKHWLKPRAISPWWSNAVILNLSGHRNHLLKHRFMGAIQSSPVVSLPFSTLPLMCQAR